MRTDLQTPGPGATSRTGAPPLPALGAVRVSAGTAEDRLVSRAPGVCHVALRCPRRRVRDGDLELLDRAPADPADRIDGAGSEKIADAEAVTVEVFARWLHDRLPAALGGPPGATPAGRVRESQLALGGYTPSL